MMLSNELIELVYNIQKTKTEDGNIEIKSANGGFPKIYDTLSAFSNQVGGTIIFGVDENNNCSVCGVYDAQALTKKISECCEQMKPPVRAICTVASIDGKNVVSAEIPQMDISEKPCFYKGAGRIKGSYIRVGDSDVKLTEYEIYSYEAFRKQLRDDVRVIESAKIEDIKTIYLQDYLMKLRIEKPRMESIGEERIFELQKIAIDSVPTLTGVMLFSEYPQAIFPKLCINAVSIAGEDMGDVSVSGARFIDNQSIDGTIPQMISLALNFVRRNMKLTTFVDSKTGERIDKTEYPITAIREIIVNALVHRDYSVHTESAPITIKMFDNRIEIENPGGLYGRITLDDLGKVSADTRNPFLNNALEILKDTENRFSGIPTIKKEMAQAKLPPPLFENSKSVFRVTLYNSNQNELIECENLNEAILEFCKISRNRADLHERFGFISKTYLFTDYVNVLVAEGMLKLGIPDKPRSKNQTYKSN